jgi:anti-sigma-K factor RskA
VNLQFHDEFVALAALFYAGELSEEEWALLQVHLAYCDSCRAAFEQYQHITSNVIPFMAASAAAEPNHASQESVLSMETAERRLMGQLNAAAPGQQSSHRRSVPWKTLTGLLAACAVGMAGLAGLHYFRRSMEVAKSNAPTQSVRVAPRPATGTKSDAALQSELESAQRDVATLQQQFRLARDQASHSNLTVADVEQELRAERAQQQQISAQKEALNQQVAAAQTDLQSLRDKYSGAATAAAQQTARADALEDKVHGLDAALNETQVSLNEKSQMLSLDKDFLAHDRDIRDVIGARNLYIADIFDTGENGRTAKPFGRIFYTKDRSLIFYGFDLDKQAGVAQPAAFQVWGQSSDKQAVSLGLFYQDDSHKRWVLRCNDEKMLARLNMVFVTVEPPGGSSKPTGKQLLRAYLQIQPNHP